MFTLKPIIIFISFLFLINNLKAQPSTVDSIAIKIIIPKVFNTNDQGVLQPYYIQKLDSSELEKFQLIIFNRWGEQMFETSNINKGWDGNFKNKALPDGVYFYLLDLSVYDPRVQKTKDLNYKGSITLIR